ncbi:MAG: glycosyltransferase family 1 protein [Clostridia bacterium]|nr:glycosyltransferase family 1 protein [Clostridia bacterium]
MKITMITIGSTGDVRPYMLLGRELKRRGHDVTVAAFAPFEDMIRNAGLQFFPISGDVVDLMNHLMKPGAVGVSYLREAEKAISKVAPLLLRDLIRAAEGAEAMVCNFFGTMYYSVAEKYGIPCVQTHFFPMDPNPLMPISSAPFPHLGRWWNRLSYRVGYLLISLLEKRYLTDWRKENGLKVRGLRTKPDYSCKGHRIPAIYATSPLLMPRPDNWDEHIYMSGFWWDESTCEFAPPQELMRFLQSGGKPIYIGFGSMVSGNMDETFQTVREAVEKSGVRAIIATGWAGEKQPVNTEQIFYADYVPHDWLFGHVSAAVHHGGAGTTASSLRAGLPTLVVPFGGDQPFWGERVYAAGCGPKPVPRDGMTAAQLAEALRDLADNAEYRRNAEAMGAAMRQEHGLQRAAGIIEQEIAAWLSADKN